MPPLSIFLQLLHSLFVLVFFVLSWAHALPNLLSALIETLTWIVVILYLNTTMTDLSDSSAILDILIPITGFRKGHDLKNQNLPSISCLKKTSETNFNYFDRFYFTKCLEYTMWKFGMNILKIGVCLTITNKSIICCKTNLMKKNFTFSNNFFLITNKLLVL